MALGNLKGKYRFSCVLCGIWRIPGIFLPSESRKSTLWLVKVSFVCFWYYFVRIRPWIVEFLQKLWILFGKPIWRTWRVEVSYVVNSIVKLGDLRTAIDGEIESEIIVFQDLGSSEYLVEVNAVSDAESLIEEGFRKEKLFVCNTKRITSWWDYKMEIA